MTNLAPLTFEAWQETVPLSIRGDALWKFIGYRKASFLYYLSWLDCSALMRDVRGQTVAHQLIRSAGSISANMEEGFGRGYGRDYSHFLVIALGSARESRGWYHRAGMILKPDVLDHRIKLLDEIISILVITSQQQRRIKRVST